MNVEKFYKVIAALAAAAAAVWLWAYYISQHPAAPTTPSPTPDLSSRQYGQNERARLLNSLRAPTTAELSVADRATALKSLRSPTKSQLSVAERTKLLDSLRAK